MSGRLRKGGECESKVRQMGQGFWDMGGCLVEHHTGKRAGEAFDWTLFMPHTVLCFDSKETEDTVFYMSNMNSTTGASELNYLTRIARMPYAKCGLVILFKKYRYANGDPVIRWVAIADLPTGKGASVKHTDGLPWGYLTVKEM